VNPAVVRIVDECPIGALVARQGPLREKLAV
jgi:hypothetical protein